MAFPQQCPTGSLSSGDKKLYVAPHLQLFSNYALDLMLVPICGSYSQPAFGMMFVMSVLIKNLEVSSADCIRIPIFHL